MNQPRNFDFLVTTALNYANGELHLGHMLELIQADIWVRTQKMLGHCLFVSGADAHGTPIMLKAMEQKQSPQAMCQHIAGLQNKPLMPF